MAVVREVTAAPSHFAAHISREPVTAVLTARLSPPYFTRPAPLFALMAWVMFLSDYGEYVNKLTREKRMTNVNTPHRMLVRDDPREYSWSQDLARSNSGDDASLPASSPQIQGLQGDATGVKRGCRAPGFISAEISDVFTLHARGMPTPDKMLCSWNRVGSLQIFVLN